MTVGDAVSLVEPEIYDFVFPSHDEVAHPSGKLFLKTGEVRGHKLDFASYGQEVRISEPVLTLYATVDTSRLGAEEISELKPVPLAVAHAERGVLNRAANSANLTGSVVIRHFENGEETARMMTDSLDCLLKEHVLTTDDPVQMSRILSPSKDGPEQTQAAPGSGALEIRGTGLRAKVREGTYTIPRDARVSYLATGATHPLVMESEGPLRIFENNESEADDEAAANQGDLVIPRVRIVLTDRVRVDLPVSFGEGIQSEPARIYSDYLQIVVENLRAGDSAYQKRMGRAVRNISASEGVRIISERLKVRCRTLALHRLDDGRFNLSATGSPDLLLAPGKGGAGAEELDPVAGSGPGDEEGDPFSLEEMSGQVLLQCKERMVFMGHEEARRGDGPEAGMAFVLEHLFLEKEALIHRVAAGPVGDSKATPRPVDGLEGQRIKIKLQEDETGGLRADHVLATGEAVLFDEKTRLEGDEIEAFPPSARHRRARGRGLVHRGGPAGGARGLQADHPGALPKPAARQPRRHRDHRGGGRGVVARGGS